ncbi:sulfhydryl oxidase 2-like [Lingula anatina]|uniref:Sulfhydryl oxidase 2-like n=1 Tax=Lingula anatina TaxID=7574 RepID=A0A1S3HU81_LINAN|nr:sulfhydryl oxidase 2-like [Lingula anatina]|eukprot:XP_013389578.1 sulfhydryl oxidase 2-like [Lingula anatina]
MVDTGTCLSWIFVFFLVFVPTAQENKGGLYSENGPVTVLTGSNFKDTVPNSDNTWMVEFYSSWCGHCVRFAPTYLKVAQFVKGWRQVIRVGAVDCAQDYNTALCKEYGIDMYPTIKVSGKYIDVNEI